MKPSFAHVILLALTLCLAACDTNGADEPDLNGTFIGQSSTTVVTAEGPVEGTLTQTFRLAQERDLLTGTFASTTTTPSGTVNVEEGLRVEGSYDFPDLALRIVDEEDTRPSMEGVVNEAGDRIELFLPPPPDQPDHPRTPFVVLRRQ